MQNKCLAFALALISGAVCAQELAVAPMGETPFHRVVGNGHIAAALAPSGRIMALRWPGPAGANQLDSTAENGQVPGAYWGLRSDDGIQWLTGSGWQPVQRYAAADSPVIVTTGLMDGGLKITQQFWCVPEANAAICHIEVQGAPPGVELVWYADFSPQVQRQPSWPVLLHEPAGLRDFAAFYDAEASTVFHFRPDQPTPADWQNVGNLLLENPGSAAEQFGAGVWIAHTLQGRVTDAACGSRSQGESAAALLGRQAYAATGDTDSAIAAARLKAESSIQATVVLGFGQDKTSVAALVNELRQVPVDTLREDAELRWRNWLATGSAAAEGYTEYRARCLRTLYALHDANSGVLPRTAAGPMSGVDAPRWSMWQSRAWQRSGHAGIALRHLQLIAALVNPSPSPNQPAGALPAGVYSTGEPASPPYAFDLDGLSAFIVEYTDLLGQLTASARGELLNATLPAFERSSELLVRWTARPAMLPLPGYDYERQRDVLHLPRLPAYHAAVDQAAALALELRLEYPEWPRRRSELEGLIRQHCLTDGQWLLSPLSFPAESRFFNPDSESGQELRQNLLAAIGDSDGVAALHGLLTLRTLGAPEEEAAAKEELDRLFRSQDSPMDYDGVAAAMAYLVVNGLSE
jgi:hypothetical protein